MKKLVSSAEAFTSSQSSLQNVFLRMTFAVSLLGMLGSFSLQVFGAQPCIYCWILRGLVITVFFASLVGLRLKLKRIVYKVVGVSSVAGVLVSGYLIYLETSGSHSLLCVITKLSCSNPPTIFGFTPGVYSLGIFVTILGSLMLSKMSIGLAEMKRAMRVKPWAIAMIIVILIGITVASIFSSSVDHTRRYAGSEWSYMSSVYSLSSRVDPVLDSDRMAFLYFYVDWCHYCQQESPIIDELERWYSDDVAFIRVNGEENAQALKEFGVSGYPTMFLISEKNSQGYAYQDFRGFKAGSLLKMSIEGMLAGPVQSVEVTQVAPQKRYYVELFSFFALVGAAMYVEKKYGLRMFLFARRSINRFAVTLLVAFLVVSFLPVLPMAGAQIIPPLTGTEFRPMNFNARCEDLFGTLLFEISDILGKPLPSAWGDTWIPVYPGPSYTYNNPMVAEGEVTYARVSFVDHPANHESQDFIFNVKLDQPEYDYLLSDVDRGYHLTAEGKMHMEWETKYFDMFAWPSVGDRVWLAGLWIWDCGHEAKTELHPLVGIATMRDVPLKWSVGGFGESLYETYTPGKRTDIWFNTWGGPATEEYLCNDAYARDLACIFYSGEQSQYQPLGPAGTVEVWQDWDFYIPMPPRPPAIYPGYYPELQYRVLPGPVSGGPDPIITPEPENSRIHVILPLDDYDAQTYSRSIEARWDYVPTRPARVFRVYFDKIRIRSDLDRWWKAWDHEGEYRLWANVNDQWIKLNLPAEVEERGYRLDQFVDVAVFEDDEIHIYVAGFEDDSVVDDNPGVAEQRYTKDTHSGLIPFGVIPPDWGPCEWDEDDEVYLCGWLATPYERNEEWPEDSKLFDLIIKKGSNYYHHLYAREGDEHENAPIFGHTDCKEDWKAPEGSCFFIRYHIMELLWQTYGAPASSLTIGDPSYVKPPEWIGDRRIESRRYVSPDTPLTLTATGLDTQWLQYRLWKVGDALPPWSYRYPALRKLYLRGYLDGVYILQFAAQGWGNVPWPILNVRGTEPRHAEILYLDATPPQTTMTIGDPQYTDALGNIYVTSGTLIQLEKPYDPQPISSGVAHTYYQIDDGPVKEYGLSEISCIQDPILGEMCILSLSGMRLVNVNGDPLPDGPHTIRYASIDNVGNFEAPNSVTLILDNARQYIPVRHVTRLDPMENYAEPGETVTYDITIENPAGVAETYDIAVTWWQHLLQLPRFEFDPPWDVLSASSVTVPPGETATITLTASLPPPEDSLWTLPGMSPPYWTPFRVRVENVRTGLLTHNDGKLAIIPDDDMVPPVGLEAEPRNGQMYTEEHPSDIRLAATWTDVDGEIDSVIFRWKFETDPLWRMRAPSGSFTPPGVLPPSPRHSPPRTYYYDIPRSEWIQHLGENIQWYSIATDNDNDSQGDELSAEFPTPYYTISLIIPQYGVEVSIDPQTASNGFKTFTYTLSVHNTGNVRDTYDLTLQGLPSTWYRFSQTSVTAHPRPQYLGIARVPRPIFGATVYLYVTPRYGPMVLKEWQFKVTATSQTSPDVSDDADATLTIDVIPILPALPEGGLAVAVLPKTSTATLSLGFVRVDLDVALYNNENFDDVIWLNITLDGIPTSYQADLAWFSWTSVKVFVPAGSSITISLTVKIPASADPGYRFFRAKATSTAWTYGKATDSGIIKVTQE